MLFFRSVCLVIAAAFVTSISASPIQELVVNSVSQPLDATETPSTLFIRRQVANLDAVTMDSGVDVTAVKTRQNDVAEAHETPGCLRDVLLPAKIQLMGVEEQAKFLIQDGRGPVGVDMIYPYIDKIHDILVVVLDDTKLFRGKPVDVILGPGTIDELAGLLCTVLTLIVGTLLSLIKCAGPQGSDIIAIIVKTVSVVLCDVITLVLGLVDGLLVLLLPLLIGITGSLMSCGLGDVLMVLL